MVQATRVFEGVHRRVGVGSAALVHAFVLLDLAHDTDANCLTAAVVQACGPHVGHDRRHDHVVDKSIDFLSRHLFMTSSCVASPIIPGDKRGTVLRLYSATCESGWSAVRECGGIPAAV